MDPTIPEIRGGVLEQATPTLVGENSRHHRSGVRKSEPLPDPVPYLS
jgi:hypothetical protein